MRPIPADSPLSEYRPRGITEVGDFSVDVWLRGKWKPFAVTSIERTTSRWAVGKAQKVLVLTGTGSAVSFRWLQRKQFTFWLKGLSDRKDHVLPCKVADVARTGPQRWRVELVQMGDARKADT